MRCRSIVSRMRASAWYAGGNRTRCRGGAAFARGPAYEVPPRILITGSLYLAGHVLA